MASIRTARILAAVAALPLATALFSGVAAADNGALANDGSNAAAVSANGGVGRNSDGNSPITQQAVGSGASNQSNTTRIDGLAFTAVEQWNHNVFINFTPLW